MTDVPFWSGPNDFRYLALLEMKTTTCPAVEHIDAQKASRHTRQTTEAGPHIDGRYNEGDLRLRKIEFHTILTWPILSNAYRQEFRIGTRELEHGPACQRQADRVKRLCSPAPFDCGRRIIDLLNSLKGQPGNPSKVAPNGPRFNGLVLVAGFNRVV